MISARQYYDSIKEDRNAWRDRQPQVCMCCGRKGTLEIHEMERRGQAGKSWGHPCNYLLLRTECHDGPFASMDHAKQLAYKLVRDPDNFDLLEWMRLKDPELRAPDRVTFADIARYLKVI